MSLEPERLASLIPLCPLLLDWLRNVTVYTADLFLQSLREDIPKVDQGLRELIQTIQANNDISYVTLAKVCTKYSPSVWATALRVILTQSSPRIIPAEIGSDLVGTIPQLNGATTVTEVCHILSPFLDKLPRTHFATLGELCALLRDTASNVTLLACLIGPQLLMPNLLLHSDQHQGPGALAAAAVLELIVVESEALFGRCASERIYHPFGEFNHLNIEGKTAMNATVDFVAAAHDKEHVVAKRALRAFYDWRDPGRVNSIDLLFSRLTMLRIAQGLQMKYGLIPPGWSDILSLLVEKAKEEHQNAVIQPKHHKKKVFTMQPRRQQPSTAFLESPTMDMINDIPEPRSSKPSIKEGPRLLGIINELVEKENKYNQVLRNFVGGFCERLIAIADGKETEADRQCLMLSSAEIHTIFGKNLRTVLDISQKLLVNLQVITDFEGQNLGSNGKLGMLVEAFKPVLKNLTHLGPYMCEYEMTMGLLREKTIELRRQAKKKKFRKRKGVHFLEVWEQERLKHEQLRLSSIDNIMIRPVQRIPQYKTLLKELLKETKKERHPMHAAVEELLNEVEIIGQQIDTDMERGKKLKQITGAGS